MPPLGLLSLAAYARKHSPNVHVTIVDGAAQSLSVPQTIERVVGLQPDVVGVTVTTMVAGIANEIAKGVKKASPSTKTVAGGPHISGVGPGCLSQLDAFDVAVTGEGEQTFVELLETFLTGAAIDNIAGILCRSVNGQVLETTGRQRLSDLDLLPLPAWDLLEAFPDAYGANIFFSPKGPAATLITSRGCPFNCAFCDQSTFGHNYCAASPEYVYHAVRNLQQSYGIRYVIFCDDTFTIDRRRVIEICRALGGLNPAVAWSCDANVMTVDREMLAAMKSAGCWSISYGLESGSQNVLRSLNKRITLDNARQAVHLTREAGIYAKGLFILGTPQESLDTIRDTQQFISSIPLSTINISKFTPYPGTELYREVSSGLDAEYEQLNGMNFLVPSKYLTVAQLEEQYGIMLRKFYHRISAWTSHLPIILGCWDNVRRLASIVPMAARAKIRRWTGTAPC